MLCQNCGQNHANTVIKTVINGEFSEYSLCYECSKNLGYTNIFSGINFNGLFESLFLNKRIEDENTCKTCGKDLDSITKDGKIGCGDCYTNFYDALLPMIEKIHTAVEHIGKSPSRPALMLTQNKVSDLVIIEQNEIEQKKRELNLAIEEQRFEDAAVLRDLIKGLEDEK